MGEGEAGARSAVTGRRGMRLAIGVAVLCIGIVAQWFAAKRIGTDYASLVFFAQAVKDGLPVYDMAWVDQVFSARFDGIGTPIGMFYPPATGFAMLPFAFLPYRIGLGLFFLALILGVILGTRALVRLVKPDATPDTWVLASCVLMASACVRWAITALQGAPIMYALLAFFLVALHSGHHKTAIALATYAGMSKFTLALPFFGLLLLHRKYVGAVIMIGAWAVFNALGFLRFGGMEALNHYRNNVHLLEEMDKINTPNPFSIVSIPRTDWIYMLFGFLRREALARPLTNVATLVSLGLAFWTSSRIRSYQSLAASMAVLGPLACISLLCVYHHHYDLVLLIPSLLLLVWTEGFTRWKTPTYLLLVPVTLLMILTPAGQMQRLSYKYLGEFGVGLYNMTFPVAITLALVGFMLLLVEFARRDQTGSVPPSAHARDYGLTT